MCQPTFEAQKELQQEDALSCLLLNIALEKVGRDAGIFSRSSIFTKAIQFLAYTDNIFTMGVSLVWLKKGFIILERAANKMDPQINEAKIKYMHVNRQQNQKLSQNFFIDKYNIETVNEFI